MREMWEACCRSQTGQIAARYHIWVLFSYRTGHISFRMQTQWKFSFRKKNLGSTYSLKGVMIHRWMWKLMLHKRTSEILSYLSQSKCDILHTWQKNVCKETAQEKKKCWNFHWQSTQRVKGPRKVKKCPHAQQNYKVLHKQSSIPCIRSFSHLWKAAPLTGTLC